MVVGRIGHRQVLRLVEDVVAFQGQGHLLLEDQLVDLRIDNEFTLARGRIAAVPVVIGFRLDREAALADLPVEGGLGLVGPGGVFIGRFDGVPRLVEAGAAARRDLEIVAAVGQAEPLHQAEGLRFVVDEIVAVADVLEIIHEGLVLEGAVVVVIAGHVEIALGDEAVRLGIGGPVHPRHGEAGLADGPVEEHPDAAVVGIVAVDGHRVGHAGMVVPDGADDRVLDHAPFDRRPQGEEGLLVGVAEFAPEVVVEIREQGRVAEGEVQRVRVVGHGHELVRGRLVGASEIEEAELGVVVDVVEHHRARRPLDAVAVFIRLLPAALDGGVERAGRVDREARLGAGLALLVSQGKAGALGIGLVQDLVGIGEVLRLPFRDIGMVRGRDGPVVPAVEGILPGCVFPPVETVGALQVEVVAEGLGIDQPGAQGPAAGIALIPLVDGRVLQVREGMGVRLVVTVDVVVGEIPVRAQGEGAARDAEPLAEQGETAGRDVLVAAVREGETVVDGGRGGRPGIEPVGREFLHLREIAPAEFQLRLDEDGGVLRELVLQAEADAVAVGEGIVVARLRVRIDQGRAVLHVGLLVSLLKDLLPRVVVHVVSGEVHVAVEEGPGAVQAAHPGGRDAVSAAPAALAAAHAPAAAGAAAHGLHHAAGQVVEAAVVGVVGVENEAQLGLFRELAHHEGALVPPVIEVVGRLREVVAAAEHRIAEHAVHHALLHGQVDDVFLVAVVDAGEFGLLGFLLDHLDLLDDLRRKVLRRDLRVVEEEGLAVDGDLGDGLAVGRNIPAFIHFHARELLQELFQGVIVGGHERGGIVLDRVFLDDDGVADGGDARGVQHLAVLLHPDDAEVDRLGDFHLLLMGLVAHQLGLQQILAGMDTLQGRLAMAVTENILGRLRGPGRRQRDGGEPDGFFGRSVLEGQGDGIGLGLEGLGGGQGGDGTADECEDLSHCRSVHGCSTSV